MTFVWNIETLLFIYFNGGRFMLSGSTKLAMKKCALKYCLNRDFFFCIFFPQFLMTTRLGVDLLPDVKPDVENMLKKCLAQEVELYKMNVQGRKCKLCPFRTFERSNRLHAHLKYHNVNSSTCAIYRENYSDRI